MAYILPFWVRQCILASFISNTDQLGQIMNRPLVGLGGKYLIVSQFIDYECPHSFSLPLCLFLSPPFLTWRVSSLEDPRPQAAKLPAK